MTSGHGPAERSPNSLPEPKPSLHAAQFRAQALGRLRRFFSHRQVLEVETPILSQGISLDCHIDVFQTPFHPLGTPRSDQKASTYFMQTSPEPHMKRLLCHGFPDIYQLTKAFRNGEYGAHHNPEFSMLEWYRKGFSLANMMDETADLFRELAGDKPVSRMSYVEAFEKALGLHPLEFDVNSLPHHPQLLGKLPVSDCTNPFTTRWDALDFLMAHHVEPTFNALEYTFIYGYPVEMASQAEALPEDARFSARFEVFSGGMELGNGYLELRDPSVYESRFDLENQRRHGAGKPELPKDQRLLTALNQGLPPCSGMAVGWDRLLMVAQGASDIKSVLLFPWDQA